ncbi:PRC-barrel domain-containing protein [Streptosporangium sp. NPDC048865]|uniref:PRC-barrel domain-containing protein n=1 Tax=Streptosporangium sp. NPDC048865 TaxID=3155766 RepID=UPI00342BC99A
MTENVWNYRPETRGEQVVDLVGFDVEATDGKIGPVDEDSNTVGESYIVVDTGFWIFGKKVVLPAGTITEIDPQERKVHVSRTKEEIKNAPEFDEATCKEPDYRDRLGGYYGPGSGTL